MVVVNVVTVTVVTVTVEVVVIVVIVVLVTVVVVFVVIVVDVDVVLSHSPQSAGQSPVAMKGQSPSGFPSHSAGSGSPLHAAAGVVEAVLVIVVVPVVEQVPQVSGHLRRTKSNSKQKSSKESHPSSSRRPLHDGVVVLDVAVVVVDVVVSGHSPHSAGHANATCSPTPAGKLQEETP